MYGEIDIEKDMFFVTTAGNDESDEEYLRLFAHKEDADLRVMLSKIDGETECLRLVSVEPIEPREARAQFFGREKTPTVINSAREPAQLVSERPSVARCGSICFVQSCWVLTRIRSVQSSERE